MCNTGCGHPCMYSEETHGGCTKNAPYERCPEFQNEPDILSDLDETIDSNLCSDKMYSID